VVQLVRQGWTNNEIADRLFLSARTVEHHLSAIYGKLGVRTRRDVAALFRDSELTRQPDTVAV
jgi:DNA-binding NarL/FixJ family response regulator